MIRTVFAKCCVTVSSVVLGHEIDYSYLMGKFLQKPMIVALTGGAASGKTLVSDYWQQQHQRVVIDTDVIARDLLAPGTQGAQAVIQKFGQSVLSSDDQGTLDRVKLGQLVFADAKKRLWLEALLHPKIRQQVGQLIQQHLHESYLLVVIPLLVEGGGQQAYERICVVDTSKRLQRLRLGLRGLDPVTISGMLAVQVSRAARLSVADDVLINLSDEVNLKRQIDRLHKRYLYNLQKDRL